MHTLREMQTMAVDSAPRHQWPEKRTSARSAAALDARTRTPAPRTMLTDAEAVAVHTARVLADGSRELALHAAEQPAATLSPAAMIARWHQRGRSLQQAVVEALQADRISLVMAYADALHGNTLDEAGGGGGDCGKMQFSHIRRLAQLHAQARPRRVQTQPLVKLLQVESTAWAWPQLKLTLWLEEDEADGCGRWT
jgi:hypothetical protein